MLYHTAPQAQAPFTSSSDHNGPENVSHCNERILKTIIM